MYRALLSTLAVLALILTVTAQDKTKAAVKTVATDDRVFELRTYYTNEGKLDDLHKRFRDHTCKLLKKHGAELIGFWTPLDEENGKGGKLVYLVAFPSRDAAKKTWAEFQKDPEWQKVYKESHKDGTLVKKVESVYLEPTDYSEMK
jgi:NIPSNAP